MIEGEPMRLEDFDCPDLDAFGDGDRIGGGIMCIHPTDGGPFRKCKDLLWAGKCPRGNKIHIVKGYKNGGK